VSTSKPRITIVGMGLIGTSLGLALRQAQVAGAVIGHDRERSASEQAKRQGAVDRTHWNLISACSESNLVILAEPVGCIEETLEAIGPELRPGCVVMDTASLKGPVMAWAAKYLPDGVHFVGGDPILSTVIQGPGGTESARADLFQGGIFCLVPSPTAGAEAVKLVTDLVFILGAKPLFPDVAEHDGLLAAVEHLPVLLSLGMLNTVIDQPAWRELRKVAGPTFYTSTQSVVDGTATDSDLFILNKDNILRWIDVLSASLRSIRELVDQEDAEALTARFAAAFEERQKWLADRSEGVWHEGPRTEMPQRLNMLDTFFGTFWRRKPKEES
jgi:prephenate dehydrogenase